MARQTPDPQRPTGSTPAPRPEAGPLSHADDMARGIRSVRPTEPTAGRAERSRPGRVDHVDARPASAEPAADVRAEPAADVRAEQRPRSSRRDTTRHRFRAGRLWLLGAGAAGGLAPTGLILLSQRPPVAGAVAALATVYIATLTTLREVREARDRRALKKR
ncbi:hypothetical protein BZB76_3857 [Actinomadura pelletieri DSM 43383]|uniref:Uncharacterized protein n=1 Tax=Actinomadura pelletieri DSM 43383 TaxID=1120940 RepID=A0A495QKX8_9ACTN|nr:hypothetical protein [Actinomadura pelletieri]RKS73173.1 hypothetical protein BZB76_3857 [Actinomadura pelletieri DSM 43383]